MVRLVEQKRPSRRPKPCESGQPAAATVSREATHLLDLQRLAPNQVLDVARAEGLCHPEGRTKQDLISDIVRARGERGETILGAGTLEVLPDGFGFLRLAGNNYTSSSEDIYVSRALVQQYALLTGMVIEGEIRPSADQRNPALIRIDSINGGEPAVAAERVAFADRTPLHPSRRLLLETGPDEIEMRVMDLVTPVGRGQRGLIVSPPRAGKTILLQKIARSILRNHPECYVIVLLIDERPEEVTDTRRTVNGPMAEVVSSTFDEPPESHIHLAELVLEKGTRMVEFGRDVVILLDSITRLARAYNATMTAEAKTMTGGLAVGAMTEPKRFFGAARDLEEGGSLTILATALVETGSRMDEVIFEEFKGTGNMEVHLDRRLVDRRVWPAININASGTRREELLLDPEELRRVWLIRRTLSDLSPVDAMEMLIGRMRKTRSNAELLMSIKA